MSFRRVAASRLYVGEEYAADLPMARIGFIVHAGQPTPDQLDPAAAIGRGTVCLFPTLTVTAAANFPQSAVAALDGAGGATIRMALFTATGALRSGTELLRGGADGVITQDCQVLVGVKDPVNPTGNNRWGSMFAAGGTMVGSGDAIAFQFTPAATNLGLVLDTLSSIVPLPSGHRRYELALSGPDRSRFHFPGSVDARAAEGLGLGMRFFRLRRTSGAQARVNAHAYPLYDLGQQQTFGLALDFAAPYEEEDIGGRLRPRTMLYPPSTPLATNLHAVKGQTVTLARSAEDSQIGFRLTKSPTVLAVDGSGKLVELGHYLTPHGEFRLGDAENEERPLRLALGLSNLESLRVRPGEGDRLSFGLGHALVGGAGGASFADDGDDLDVLDRHCRTAWTNFLPGGSGAAAGAPLAMDPEGMPGYVAAGGKDMPFRASRYAAPPGAFPMVPLLGLGRSTGAGPAPRERLDLERHVISRVRRRELTSENSLRESLADSTGLIEEVARTPQGYLLAGPTTANAWVSVTFGRTAKSAESAVNDFGLVASTDQAKLELKKVLAGNRLFLVTRASQLRSLGFDPAGLGNIFMAGWEAALLRAKENDASASDPFIILKHDDRPVAELYKDPRNWTARDAFLPAGQVATVQEQIERSLDASADKAGLYAPLRRRLNDPNWNGALVLGATLYKDGLPDQLRALAANLPDLTIHHVGVDLSAITGNVEAGKAWPTAVFGVVDYAAPPETPYSEDPGLSMLVARLVLRIENDSVDRFECAVKLKLHQLFDVQAADPEKVLVLEGRYESRVDKDGRKQESYRFLTERATGGAIFAHDFADPSLVASVRLDRLELLTIKEGEVYKGRYLVDGDIKFRKISDLDLLGVDALDFTGFGLDFDLQPFKVTFNYPSMRFDLGGFNRGAIGRRAGSLLAKFPLKLRGFRFGDFNLPKLGYFDFGDIELPEGFKPSADFKYGFDFDLDLGSLGALAKKLDRFKLQIVIGWKPKLPDGGKLENLLAFGFRLDLGEGAGGIDLGLQGIMRLTAERFNLKKVKHPADENEVVIVLSAYNTVLEILGQRLPTQKDQRFSLFLFGDLGGGLFERPGWYASFKDESPSKPIALERLTLGQRVNVRFDDLTSTMAALTWLDRQETFGKDDEQKFVDFAGKPGSVVKYDPDREWFLAAKGEFFSVARVALLLRDPDLYGAYLGILGSAEAPIFFLDLLYEKLGDGVGRYSVEVMLPEAFRTFDVGAVSITIGVIRAELYTDGGFLIDLGMPKHVDYSRSFVVQGGPFIGKGGFYIGRVPRQAAPLMSGLNIGDVFRAGMALRIGLGREFEKGPLRVGVSVSVFGRVEGAFARLKNGSSYAVALQGEVGIIAELEGSVDLRLIRARVFVRIWVAAGITLVTSKPILLHCEAGVAVSVVVVIGRIRVFRRTIQIKVRLSYHTRIRFEWELPARVPAIGLLEHAGAALAAPGTWELPDFTKLGVAPAPFQLRLVFDAVRTLEAGTPHGRAIPTVVWLEDDGLNAGRPPFADVGRALVAWAALQVDPAAAAADEILLSKSKDLKGAVPVAALRDQLGAFDEVDPEMLQRVFTQLFDGSKLAFAENGARGDAFAFPVPPGLRLEVGGEVVDFAAIGLITDAEADALMAHLDDQFAEIASLPRAAAAAGATGRPLVERMFQEWCQLLALTTLDALDEAFVTDGKTDVTVRLGDLWAKVEWEQVAGRAGRLFHSGARVPRSGGGFEPLLARAGLFLEVASGDDPDLAIAGVGPSSWLTPGEGALKLDGAGIARLAAPAPEIAYALAEAPAVRLAPRGFGLPDFTRITGADGQPKALLGEFSGDLRRQLAQSAGGAFPASLRYLARKPRAEGQGPIEETPLAHVPARCLVFDMVVERIAVQTADGATTFLPDSFQIAGASEAERVGIDALLRGDEAEVTARLAGSRLVFAWKTGEQGGHAQLMAADAPADQVLLARATVSVERRPMDAGLAELVDPEDIHRATLAAGDRFAFLTLLQRAAIVNSGGTYLIVPPAVGTAMQALFGDQQRAQLSFVLEYADAAKLSAAAVNAVLVAHAADRALVDPPGGERRILTARAEATDMAALAAAAPGLVEPVALRPPGTELLRVWRKSPPDAAAAGDADAVAAHLQNQFDMLEFEVRSEAGELLLGFDSSLPLASELAVPETAPDQIRAWLDEEREASGFEAKDFRYDLILPLARLAAQRGLGEGPYAGVGRKFRIRTGWRDLYGNRLEAHQKEQQIHLLYRDPLTPVDAWPGVNGWFEPGAAGSRALELTFDLEPSETQTDRNSLAASGLRRVVQQLTAPGVSVTARTPLGQLADAAVPVADLAAYLTKVADHLEAGGQRPAPFRHRLTLASMADQPFLPLELSLVVAREPALVAAGSVPGAARIEGSVSAAVTPEAADSGAAGRFAAAFQDAFSTPESPAAYWVARGQTDAGDSAWWAVDARVTPKKGGDRPAGYAPPPLALAALSALVADVPVIPPGADGTHATNTFAQTEERKTELRAHDRDSDELMQAFLARVDAFLSPLNAPVTARAPAAGAPATPFERVARARARLLGRDDAAASPLLRFVQGVRVTDTGDEAARQEALRSLREACAAELERYNTVGGVLVQPLASAIPASWFDDEPRPKIYGRLRFAGAAEKLGFRAMARGIELREGRMELGVVVIPETTEGEVNLAAHGAVAYECTHVERIVERPATPGRLAPSRWLTFVPTQRSLASAATLPVVELAAAGEDLLAPTPFRRVPSAPQVSNPTLSPYDKDPTATYAEAVSAARRWTFGFDVGAEFELTDQFCGRLVYNGALGGAQVQTETPADPLFPNLFEALVGFEARTAPYWPVIAQEAGRRPSGGGSASDVARFENACARFAEAVEETLKGFETDAPFAARADLLEDRFIITVENGGQGRRTRIVFADHLLPGDPGRTPEAGEGRPWLRISQLIGSDVKATTTPEADWPEGVFDFATAETGLRRRRVEIGRLDAVRLQSAWAAGSVRRNVRIAGEPAHRRFVYRTPEIYLQQVSVPNLVRRRSIVLDGLRSETLAQRLQRALEPVFVGQMKPLPAQVRFDFESGRMVDLIASLSAGGEPDFTPDPDAKVQFAGVTIGQGGDWSVAQLASAAATSLLDAFRAEPPSKDGRVLVGMGVQTAVDGVSQPLLRITRLVVPLSDLTDVWS